MTFAGWKSGARRSVNDLSLTEQADQVPSGLCGRSTTFVRRHRQHRADRRAIHPFAQPSLKLEIMAGGVQESLERVDAWKGGSAFDPGNRWLRDATGGRKVPLRHPASATRHSQYSRGLHPGILAYLICNSLSGCRLRGQ
jgi:hypothetical protein